MNLIQGVRLLDKEPTAHFRCTNCSYPIVSYNDKFGVCPFCELHSDKSDDALKSDKPLIKILNDLQEKILSGKFDDALKLYDSLFELTKNVGALYSKGVFHTFLADIDFAKRDYATPNGYMEDNSIHSKAALAHFSLAKALFFKTISLIEADSNLSNDSNLLYTKFLCEIKLSKLGDAKNSLSLLNASWKDLPITLYANMVYYSVINQNHAEAYFEKVISIGIPNALYYYSNFLSERNNLNGAKLILNKLSKRLEMSQAKKLSLGIERVQTIL